MSTLPSVSTVLSLLSFLATVFALARVGAAAFSANQSTNTAQVPRHVHLQLDGPHSMSLSQAIRFGVGAEREKEKNTMGVGYVGGHELVRMPSTNWSSVRRPGLLFRPPSPFPDQQKPLSMAKLIMSRHNHRKASRSIPTRRPPGLPILSSSRSRLIEEV
ncbi:hypothetical protein M0805_004538 [Coniferiporia weirii]|nr:hypothetical protein M0805_004538 [Coniferiporia weirii]